MNNGMRLTIRNNNLTDRHSNSKGFSLAEVLVAAAIFLIIIVGVLLVFVVSSALNELSKNMTLAMVESQSKLEEIRNHSFDLIMTDYSSGGTPGNIFNLTSLNGKGAIYISNTMPPANVNLLRVKIVACWQESNGRIIGEDINLNGSLDPAEDLNGNSELDSLANIISFVAKR